MKRISFVPALAILGLSTAPLFPTYPQTIHTVIPHQVMAAPVMQEQATQTASIVSVYVEPTPEPTPIPTIAARPVKGEVQPLIVKWAGHYGVSADWMLRVAKCESGLSRTMVNHSYYSEWGQGNPTGLFQFLPKTFYVNASRVGLAGADIWNPDHQAQVAAWLFSKGQATQWECK